MEASFARSILLDAPMAVVAVDRKGVVRSANATAEGFFGQDLTSAPVRIGKLIEGLDVGALKTAEGLQRFNAGGRNKGPGVYMRVARLDGSEAFVDVQAAHFSVKDEQFLTLFIQDVTAVVAAENAVQDLRLQITYNWRLNSLGEMASMVAHELNQPLSAILNFLEAARSVLSRPQPDHDKILKFMSSAEAQAERAADVIRRLRTLMSRDTGFHAEANLDDVVAEVMPILQINARELNADIVVCIPRDACTRCDRVQIQQLIINLVRNALDAPATGHRRCVMISSNPVDNGHRILVEDNGPGVSDAVSTRLFDPLASTKPGGMGLGLSICRTIVEAHGGVISHVPSKLGGAGFAFTLIDRTGDA